MKELSIEEKAKAYDEAIEKAKIWQEHLYDVNDNDYADELNYIFPKLEESKDESIRKEILAVINDLILPDKQKERFVAWLEKQGEQKLDDEPKFEIEEGKWYICIRDLFDNYANKAFCKGDIYLSTQNGSLIPSNSNVPFKVVCPDTYFKDWTIQDAKDGDVLHSTGRHNDCIFIFNGLDNWIFDEPNGDRAVATGYCCLFVSADKMEFGIQGPDCIEVNTIKPATKIQRDLLFQKMKEAGYEWDAEKKELKKIEQKHTEWSVEDEERYESCLQKLGTGNPEQPETINSKWFKEHVYSKPQWKPSDKQIYSLDRVLSFYGKGTVTYDFVKELLEQLKKL